MFIPKKEFDFVFPYISNRLLEKIIEDSHISDDQAINLLYSSEFYGCLEHEETNLWKYDIDKLFDMYKLERREGHLVLLDYAGDMYA